MAFARVAKALVRRKMKINMREWKAGTLLSSSGQKVTSQKQAEAISYSQARALAKKR